MATWDRCIHWRVCQRPCPSSVELCAYYAPADNKAKWIYSAGGTWTSCSGCGSSFKEETKYCPNCGAKMGE